ncbi:hypothetical protein EOD41_08405 [Mucilaginibacter limnophilus]|uniref:TonB C-terminal domain-containing protein n=1 Tax=Mucilaginibacter limnophilus TaxID=1932778 RepID=A0A437MWC7_9SPHI|nr:hypothetical protein [Mucilaginibacter limnophilus]RVU01963.1 hypothetical protein EOD41_08405 [Mucilaginibacter limnophilus]
MKPYLALLIAFLLSGSVYAQTQLEPFKKNIQRMLVYPAFLRQTCTPAFTNMLIDIDGKGKVVDVKISDSAPDLLREEFNKIKGSFKLELLNEFITAKKLKDCGIIIPLFWVYGNDYCVNAVEETWITNNYFAFDSNMYTKLTFNAQPIVTKLYKPVR